MGTSDSHLELAGCGRGLERLEKPFEGGGGVHPESLASLQETQGPSHGILVFVGLHPVLPISEHPVIFVSLRHGYNVVVEKQVSPLMQRLLVGHPASPPPSLTSF